MSNRKLKESPIDESLRIGQVLKYYKVAKGYSTLEISRIMGVATNTVLDYEKGFSKVPVIYIFRLIEELKINFDEFYRQYKAGYKSIYICEDSRSARQIRLSEVFRTLNKMKVDNLIKVANFIQMLEGRDL